MARESEAVAREAAWHAAQQQRLAAELRRLREAVATLEAVEYPTGAGEQGPAAPGDDAQAALNAWDQRSAELREQRDRLAARLATHDASRLDAEHRRARAEAAAMLSEERVARAERDVGLLGERETRSSSERDTLRGELASAAAAEASARGR